jgi:16S rRNA (cytosine1402-N4)-methyltransferase
MCAPSPSAHVPVLLHEVLEYLDPQPGDVVVDATVGAGGHARALGERIGPEGMLIGLDVDPASLATAEAALASMPCPVHLRQANFEELPEVLRDLGSRRANVVLADCGVNSDQLADAERGISFQTEGPLDMRLDPRLTETAESLVNRLPEKELADLLFYKGQEGASRKIARRICLLRKSARITTTQKLVEVICGALRVNPTSRRSKIHPATRSFQALRIAVNRELEVLERLVEMAPYVLTTGARMGVISFHSLEDKIVKSGFRRWSGEGLCEVLTKKPIVAGEDERLANPRSRSAKFRVIRCTKPLDLV